MRLSLRCQVAQRTTYWMSRHHPVRNSPTVVQTSPLRFYEKVIKVKADVAALHIVFLRHQRCCVRWRGELSRAPSLGVHLDP